MIKKSWVQNLLPPILAIVKFVQHKHTQKKDRRENNNFLFILDALNEADVTE